MGRTMPTFRRAIDSEAQRWNDMRRALGPEAQRAFDAVFQRARRHASAAGNQGALDPMDAIVMTVLVEHERELERLLTRVAFLEAEVEKRASADPARFASYGPVDEAPFMRPSAHVDDARLEAFDAFAYGHAPEPGTEAGCAEDPAAEGPATAP